MRLISRVLSVSDRTIRCIVDQPLPEGTRDSPVSSWWAIEMAAQAAGLLLANREGDRSRQPVEGRLVQVRDLELGGPELPPGSQLLVVAELKSSGSQGLNTFQCDVTEEPGGEKVLQALLSVLVLQPADTA